MKKTYPALLIVLISAIQPTLSSAQFMKTLLNNAKNSIAGHPNSTGTKKDSTVSAAGKAQDSILMAQKFASLATQRPAGPSISPADSAAAIKSFMTASGGAGQYYQYQTTYTFRIKGKDSVFRDTAATELSDAFFARTDFILLGDKSVLISRASTPHYSIRLHPNAKTFQLHIIDTAALSRGDGMTYQAVRIGNERMQGYDCIHARLTLSHPGSKNTIVEDVWTSTQVSGYAALKKMYALQNVTIQFLKALEQAGCEGFIVKTTTNSTEFSAEVLLIQATRKSFPASDFEIPSGYTQEKESNPLGHLFQQ